MSHFDYLIDKVEEANFSNSPFEHVYIENFLKQDDFDEIISSPEISLNKADNDGDLFEKLFSSGYKIVPFPGCITNKEDYLNWRQNKENSSKTNIHSACESFGMVLRLNKPDTTIIKSLKDFINSKDFNSALAKKFNIEFESCSQDSGIQKYLDGYEISPHPDLRKKALTYMVNINPADNSESIDYHTHYLKLNESRKYVTKIWEGNPDYERCWIPWDWCSTDLRQTQNNSIVIFSPHSDSYHGVKAKYNHLITQRTQLYGNLWYSEAKEHFKINWESLDFKNKEINSKRTISFKDNLKKLVPDSVKTFFSKTNLKNQKDVDYSRKKHY
tara:strand:- start:961 stop:1947 length:987 start_codon:yes stop_codon:yes gene_type:complete